MGRVGSSSPPPSWVEPQTPYPPRWRLTTRLALLYAIVVGGFIALYVGWCAHARGRMERTLSAIRASGEPATHDDLIFEPVLPSQDGRVPTGWFAHDRHW